MNELYEHGLLGDLCYGVRGVSYKPENLLSQGHDNASTLLRSNNIQFSGLHFSDLQYVPNSLVGTEQVLKKGDIAVCMSNGSKLLVGKSAICKVEQLSQLTVGAFCSVFKCFDSDDAEFVSYLFQSDEYKNSIDVLLAGSAINNLKNSDIENIRLPVAPKPVRTKIAKVLSTIDNQIEQTQALIDKYTAIKQGMMADLFSRGIDPKTGELRPTKEQAPELYWKSELGWIPNDWRTSLLGEISDLVRGSTPRPAKDPRYFNGNFAPWITVGELSKDKWPFLMGTSTKLTQEGTLYSRKLEKGTLVISNSGFGCGVPKILDIEGYANDGVAAFLNLDNSADKLFLYYYLSFNTLELRKKVARGNDQPNLNTEMLSDYQIIFPAKVEQEDISERLLSLDELINEFSNEKQKLQTQKQGLMQDLLTGKKSVDNLLDSMLEITE